MKKKVYLIDLGTGTNRNLLPLSIGLVGSYSMARAELRNAYDLELLFLREDPKLMVQKMLEPVIVGFATYVWNFHASLSLAKLVSDRFPSAQIVFGGYSVPKDPKRIADFFVNNPWVNILVHNEGELTFAHLLEEMDNRYNLSNVNGITFQTKGVKPGFHTTQPRERIADLNILPSPFLNGMFDALIAQYGDRVTGAIWETNRGCPYKCTFCDWGNRDTLKVKKYDVQRLKEELKWFSKNKINYIYVADANFGLFFERDLGLAGEAAALKRQTGFPGYFVICWAKNSHERIVAIADRFVSSGIDTFVSVGVQSMDKDVLTAIKRRNMSQDSMLKLKNACHDKNIPTSTVLILGLPCETYDSFMTGLNTIMTKRLDDYFLIFPLTLLENAEMSDPKYRATYGIETRVCKLGMSRRESYDSEETEEVVVGTLSMPPKQWRRTYIAGYLVTVLYNHRLAFFIMNYLQSLIGNEHTDFVEFVLKTVESDSNHYPVLDLGIGHVQKQCELILNGISSTSSPSGLDNLVLTPHEACAALLLGNSEALYLEFRQIVCDFLDLHRVDADPRVLDEVVRYQQIIMPSWPIRTATEFKFTTNIPVLLNELILGSRGSMESALAFHQTFVKIKHPCQTPKTYHEFAATLVTGGHTLRLLDHTVSSTPLAQVQR